MHLLARHTGLIRAIDQQLHLLKRHLPYHESDHVLNLAYNILCHGDFCRRFREPHVLTLMEIINQIRPGVWKRQPETFFRQAILEADGTIAETTGECKEGMDISYKGAVTDRVKTGQCPFSFRIRSALATQGNLRWSNHTIVDGRRAGSLG